MSQEWSPRLGATLLDGGRCRFCVWSPEAKRMDLHLIGDNDRLLPMKRDERGYFEVEVEDIQPGQRYRFRLDDHEYPDPASRAQPDGVFEASAAIDSAFDWHDEGWGGLALEQQIQYEIHVGTYTQEGTFDALIPRLDRLVELGINTIELMPVNQCPGARNWGYDGVFLFAVQNSYGGAPGLKRLVDACHRNGIAVILDAVYNHFGPEGNVMSAFGPYTTDSYKTPWGEAINVDGPYSDEVREFFFENALYWLGEYHVDGLRLDATHYIFDFSVSPFLAELAQRVHDYGRRVNRQVVLIAESDRNDAALVRDKAQGGTGMDGQWLDDFHHTLHTVVTHENFAYYMDYGAFDQLVKAWRDGFVYSGQYAPTRKRRHGTPSTDIEGSRFVVFIQNHDQIGNRMPNDRLSKLFTFEMFKLAVGSVLLSPYVPLLFMGDEYGEVAPFEYFADYRDGDLCEAVRKGRVATFGHLLKEGEQPPDPFAEATFMASKLNHDLCRSGSGPVLFEFHRTLIALRKSHPVLSDLSKRGLNVIGYDDLGVIVVTRSNDAGQVFMAFNFDEKVVSRAFPIPSGRWQLLFDSRGAEWRAADDPKDPAVNSPKIVDSDGEAALDLPPQGFIVYQRQSRSHG